MSGNFDPPFSSEITLPNADWISTLWSTDCALEVRGRCHRYIRNYTTDCNFVSTTALLFLSPFPTTEGAKELSLSDGDEELGMTMELCAGIVDKKASFAEIGACSVVD